MNIKSKSEYLYIEFNCNYGDEFDLNGFIILTESQWEDHKKLAKKVFDKKASTPLPEPEKEYSWANSEARIVNLYFGTNEYLPFDSLESYLDCFKLKNISYEECIFFEKFFQKHNGIKNGVFVMIQEDSI